MLALRCVPNANYQPTVCNGFPTLAQRCPNVVMLSGQEGLRRVFPYARWLDIYGRFVISAVLLVSKTGENHTLMLHLCLWRRQIYINHARCWVRSENSLSPVCSICKFHVPLSEDDIHLSIIFVVGAQYYVEISPTESTRSGLSYGLYFTVGMNSEAAECSLPPIVSDMVSRFYHGIYVVNKGMNKLIYMYQERLKVVVLFCGFFKLYSL